MRNSKRVKSARVQCHLAKLITNDYRRVHQRKRFNPVVRDALPAPVLSKFRDAKARTEKQEDAQGYIAVSHVMRKFKSATKQFDKQTTLNYFYLSTLNHRTTVLDQFELLLSACSRSVCSAHIVRRSRQKFLYALLCFVGKILAIGCRWVISLSRT